MKKILSSILIIILLIALLGVNVYAGNGPMPPQTDEYGTWDEAYIIFFNQEGYEDVYRQSTVKNEMNGAVYNKSTNTLTITNLQTDMSLETNLMGDDFKINVVGTNKIPRISVWGYGYGGSVYFTGTGTLTVNENKEYNSAINLYAEGSNSAIRFANTVNVNLYAKTDVINVYITESTNAIRLENCQSANIVKSDYYYTGNKEIKGFVTGLNTQNLMQATKSGATSKIFGVAESRKFADGEDIEDPNAGTRGYSVYELIEYNGSYYCLDQVPDRFLTEAQFAEQGYSIKLDGESNPLWYNDVYTYWNTFEAYQLKSHANTDVYVIEDGFSNVQGDETIAVVLEKIPGTEDIYVCNPVTGITQNELEEIILNEKIDGLYNYVLKGTSFIYKAGQTHTHTFDGGAVTKKATFTADGVKTYTCTSKDATKTEAIAKVSNVKLDKTSYTYDGKAKKPTVTVKDSKGKVLKNGTDYTVSYPSGRKNVGKYKVKVTLKGNYTGSKDFEFTIKPKGTSLSKLTAGKKQFKATWKAQKTQTSGYELQYATNSGFSSGKKTVNIKKNKITSETVKKLKAKKKYYVKIRTYKTVSGKKICSGWSKVKNITTKK